MIVLRSFVLCILLGILAGGRAADAQTADNVLLVVNDSSAASNQIGDYYARKRLIPSSNVLHLTAPTTEQVSRADFERTIEAPLAAWFTRTGAHDRILYIVLTKGLPLRIAGTGGLDGTVASVDSELTLLYRRLTGVRAAILGRVENPYFAGTAPVASWKSFTHQTQDVFLVTRLDGFTVADVLALIDRGAAPSREGRFVLDQKATIIDRGGDAWLQNAAAQLSLLGFRERVTLDSSRQVVTGEHDVLGYYSWGSNDPAIKVRHFDFTFAPGALAAMFVSSDGRTFTEPPAEWKIGGVEPRSQFAGSPQSLAGDLIRDGVTGIAAHVAEPYLDATIRPEVLFPAYVSGMNLAESYYLAMPFLSWQTVVIGDPLCAPFRTKPLPPEQINPGIDTVSELPKYFSARRLQAFMRPGWNAEGAGLVLRAEVRSAKGDQAGARDALEKAVVLDGRIDAAHRLLGIMYDSAGEYDKAIQQYRETLALVSNDAVALNNLAFDLAVRRNQAQEALPLAQRAYTSSGSNPVIGDTLAWIQHLLGHDTEAAALLAAATKQGPVVAEIHLHAAVVFEAIGRRADAVQALERALKAEPELAKNEEALRLQEKLQR